MRRPLSKLILTALLGLIATTTQAAPQILGVIASVTPIPLVCRGKSCSAELTTFCLQEWSSTSKLGTFYEPTGGDGLTLIGHRTDGVDVALESDATTFESLGGFASIYVELSRQVLEERGLTSASVIVGSLVSFLPVPIPNDPDPQTELDIKIATGPLRQVAVDILHEGDERTAAAGMINCVIALLPDTEEEALATSDGGWRKLASNISLVHDGSPAKDLAQREYALCHTEIGPVLMNHDYRLLRMRKFLSSKHDGLVLPRAQQYWATVDAGI